ncbi:MAG: hypothetical protein GWM90_03585 [Gemmatimonadetes bacterium]|nr:hypothetical protein [Gemmatimonadota bacterium]NIQ52731.1 hypothetical protein [Gemmatimonadota bacterium]NIU72871.1 hypothetical protein [Gammaproteobacteria bacterium]NIX43232.1 hypothetical protein [Gemmatimonadota bacterium]NIY07406.1 hypothetical protein [Gemmatimonadota bacterium]
MRRPRMHPLTLAVLMALVTAAPAAAQEAEDLNGVMNTLAALWTRGDAVRLADYGAAPGLDLEIHGEMLGPVEGRRAEAALRQLFESQQTVAVIPGRSTRVVGAEDRAFGELTWTVRVPGSLATERSTVFVGLVHEASGWRISQIRILP